MKNLFLVFILISVPGIGCTQLSVAEIDEDEAADIIAGPGVEILAFSHYGGTNQLGSFSGGSGILGIESGVVLTTGNIELAGTGNGGNAEYMAANGSDFSSQLSAEYPGTSLHDVSALQITFKATSTSLQFDIVFASDEYLEYVGADYNDAIAVYIDGPGFSEEFAGFENVALVPGSGDLVNIDNVNTVTNATWFVNNPPVGGPYSDVFTYDGFTKKMTIVLTGLSCGSNYNMQFAVADARDEYYDAALFIGANSIQSNFAVGEIAVVDDSPFCEGDEFTASITYNPSWNYTWSTGETGFGVNSVTRTAVFGTDEISVVVEDGDGCSAERTAEAIVHSNENDPPSVANTIFTYYTGANEEFCLNIYANDHYSETAEINLVAIDGDFSVINFSPVALIPEVNHEVWNFCWTPNEYDYGVNSFTISVTDNNACGSLTQNFTFYIIVICPLCPECIYYENRTPDSNPLPPFTEAARCIEAGFSEPVVVGDDEVVFKAGESIELGDFFVDGPFFAEITGETCLEECTDCCDDWSGFRYDYWPDSFAPDGDGDADYWTLNDRENTYCAFNATGFEIWVGNNWSRSDAFFYRSHMDTYCCPFLAANNETELEHTAIYWDGSRDDGDYCVNNTYHVVVRLYACENELEIHGYASKVNDEDYSFIGYDSTLQVQGFTNYNHNSMQIYPNPAKENITITINPELFETGSKLSFYNMKNETVLEHLVTDRTSLIDVSSLSSGIYVVICSSSNGMIYSKFVVK